VKVTSKSLSKPSPNDELIERIVTVNRNSLFIYTNEENAGKSYRGNI